MKLTLLILQVYIWFWCTLTHIKVDIIHSFASYVIIVVKKYWLVIIKFWFTLSQRENCFSVLILFWNIYIKMSIAKQCIILACTCMFGWSIYKLSQSFYLYFRCHLTLFNTFLWMICICIWWTFGWQNLTSFLVKKTNSQFLSS